MRCGRVGRHRPHDGVHVSLRAGDALPATPGDERCAGRSRAFPCTALPGLGPARSGVAPAEVGSRHRRARRHALASARLRAPSDRPLREGQRADAPRLRLAHRRRRRVAPGRRRRLGRLHRHVQAGRHRLPREHQGRQRPRRRRHRSRPLRDQRHRRQRQLSPRRSARRADGPQGRPLRARRRARELPGRARLAARSARRRSAAGLPLRPDLALPPVDPRRRARRPVVPRRAGGADRDGRDRAVRGDWGDRQHRAELGDERGLDRGSLDCTKSPRFRRRIHGMPRLCWGVLGSVPIVGT